MNKGSLPLLSAIDILAEKTSIEETVLNQDSAF